MSDSVIKVLIVVVALIIVLLIFRKKLRNFIITWGKDGLGMKIATYKEDKSRTSSQKVRKSSGVSVSGNKLWGRKNKIDIRTGSQNVSADENEMLGEEQEITVKPESKRK